MLRRIPPLFISKDIQREFYEQGYGGPVDSARSLTADFDQQSSDSRISRGLALLRGASGHLLDVGCGGGSLLYLAKDQFTQLTGVDIAEAQLRRARVWSEGIGQQVGWYRRNLDCEPLPLPDGTVDAAACLVVLEFVLRPDFVMSEIARVLRPGGIFVCSSGNIVSWRNRARIFFGQDPRTTTFMNAINGGALHHFTQATFVALLQRSGLEIESVGCSGRGWRLRRHWPALLGGDILVKARKRS